MPFVWNESDIEKLKNLWIQGLTAREIAMQIGSSVTRNAVIGKANRLGLSSQKKTAPADPYEKRRIPTDFECQWPVGDVENPDFHFCGHPVSDGRTYCDTHARQAFRRYCDGAE